MDGTKFWSGISTQMIKTSKFLFTFALPSPIQRRHTPRFAVIDVLNREVNIGGSPGPPEDLTKHDPPIDFYICPQR